VIDLEMWNGSRILTRETVERESKESEMTRRRNEMVADVLTPGTTVVDDAGDDGSRVV
jgi:hypothetical protein